MDVKICIEAREHDNDGFLSIRIVGPNAEAIAAKLRASMEPEGIDDVQKAYGRWAYVNAGDIYADAAFCAGVAYGRSKWQIVPEELE